MTWAIQHVPQETTSLPVLRCTAPCQGVLSLCRAVPCFARGVMCTALPHQLVQALVLLLWLQQQLTQALQGPGVAVKP